MPVKCRWNSTSSVCRLVIFVIERHIVWFSHSTNSSSFTLTFSQRGAELCVIRPRRDGRREASSDLILFQISARWPRHVVSVCCSSAFALTEEISSVPHICSSEIRLVDRMNDIWSRDLWLLTQKKTWIPHPNSMTHLDNRCCKYKNLNSLPARLAISSLSFKEHFCFKGSNVVLRRL